MNTIINFKTETRIKKSAQELAEKFGLSLSDVINILLRNFINKKELNIDLKETDEDNLILLEKLKESENDKKSPTFDNANDAIKWLNSSKRIYEN